MPIGLDRLYQRELGIERSSEIGRIVDILTHYTEASETVTAIHVNATSADSRLKTSSGDEASGHNLPKSSTQHTLSALFN